MYLDLDSFRLMLSDLIEEKQEMNVRSWLELMWRRRRMSSE